MSLVLQSSGGGSVTLQEPVTASNLTITVPAVTGTMITTASTFAGTGPTFSASKSGSNQSITSSTFTKVTFNTENFDTNSNFDSSTFTPTVAGYYQINTTLTLIATSGTRFIVSIFKNGSEYARGVDLPISTSNSVVGSASTIIYLNGTTDFIDVYAYVVGTTPSVVFGVSTYFDGALVRAA